MCWSGSCCSKGLSQPFAGFAQGVLQQNDCREAAGEFLNKLIAIPPFRCLWQGLVCFFLWQSAPQTLNPKH